MKKIIFIKNTIILTATALFLRFAGVIFKIWLSSKTGSEAIGLYQIIMSVYVFATSFAASGLSTAVTRLVTEYSTEKSKNVKNIVSTGLFLTAALGFATFLLLFFGSEIISELFIKDARAILPIKIMAVGVIFVGFCSCLRGYFIAKRSALSSSVSQIIEQLVRIGVTAALIFKFDNASVSSATSAIVFGDITAEIVSCAFLYLLYLLNENSKKEKNHESRKKITGKILNIALPITSGRYLSTFLRTAESTAVPHLLTEYGMTASAALSTFGIIKGMALPLLLFPSAVLSAVSLLLITELSEAKAKGSTFALKRTIYSTLKLTLLISVILGIIFWFCGEKLGILLYNSTEVGKAVKLLAPLTPLMYIDSISDGMLKGLNKQKTTFVFSVTDSALRLILIFLILPHYGFNGFIFIMYLSNIFTGVLNFYELIKTADIKINVFSFAFIPVFSGITVCFVLYNIFNFLFFKNLIYVILFSGASVIFYFLILYALGVIKKSEFI